MTAPSIPLTTIQGGINRLRTKGGANNQSLYDLLNGYVTSAQTVKVRPGSIRTAVLPSATKGLVAFQNSFHVFCNTFVEVPDGYTCHVLTHPLGQDPDHPVPIAEIHFAAPFLGFLYVVAEFEPVSTAVIDAGLIFHYWLQGYGTGSSSSTWQPDKVYMIGDIATPTVPNGLAYRATRFANAINPVWTPNTVETLNNRVEPTVPNGYYFIATEVDGDNPVTGATEPVWPTSTGATVAENSEIVDGQESATPGPAPQPTTPAPSSATQQRYANPAGGFGAVVGAPPVGNPNNPFTQGT